MSACVSCTTTTKWPNLFFFPLLAPDSEWNYISKGGSNLESLGLRCDNLPKQALLVGARQRPGPLAGGLPGERARLLRDGRPGPRAAPAAAAQGALFSTVVIFHGIHMRFYHSGTLFL